MNVKMEWTEYKRNSNKKEVTDEKGDKQKRVKECKRSNGQIEGCKQVKGWIKTLGLKKSYLLAYYNHICLLFIIIFVCILNFLLAGALLSRSFPSVFKNP